MNDESKEGKLSLWFNSSSLKIGNDIKTSMSINDGQLIYQNNNYIEKIAIDLAIITDAVNNARNMNIQLAGTCLLSHMGNQGGCYVTGICNSQRGRFSLCNAYNSFMIDPIIITEKEIRASGHFPLSYVMQCVYNSVADQIVQGTAHFSIKADRQTFQKVEGHVVMENVIANQFNICDVGKIIFEHTDDDWKVRLGITRANQECKGVGYWRKSEQKGELFLSNNTDLSSSLFNYWRIKRDSFFMKINAQNCLIDGNYQATATNVFNDTQHLVKGSFSSDYKVLSGRAFINEEEEFDIQVALDPELALQHCSYKDKEKKELLFLKAINDTKAVEGSIAFAFIRSIINSMARYDLQGEGNFTVTAHVRLPEIVAEIILKDATIRLPQTYNFIDGFNAHLIYNIAHKTAVFENINLSLHTGKVNSLRATYTFNEKGSLIFMHAPFILDRCLLNIKKDLFAIVSGHLLFSKNITFPACVKGHVFIDKAQLKENLFSGIIQKQLVSYTHSVFSLPDVPLYCDLTVETKSPIRVDTGFLQTNAQINMSIKKEKYDPCVTGSVILHSGMLNFPYKPLYISTGIITFAPEQLFDPTVEFVARNKIKKYDVSLQIEGSLLTHHIALDATPPLLEEQIVGLLLVGSEENSLNSMMPALIVQNLKNLIFSNNQLSFFDKYFKPFLGTLNINLVPSFADQSGRGGLKGALEITVDDRWRAVIQKNFSLTEDTKFELEYLFSDDITFRAIRDERRDLGGEIEMRWKF